ncbi:uncharacterized protein DMAD_13667 [Drosophila madeirensis]|uniref:C2H2-type domain-containing protein n=1 Tax=Drosophila madeirensis TaxID=30013 RepID=A0AAU9GFG8_DROMD
MDGLYTENNQENAPDPTTFNLIFKMDAADFWQQARAPFGLHTALHQHAPPNQEQTQLQLQQHQQQQQQHHHHHGHHPTTSISQQQDHQLPPNANSDGTANSNSSNSNNPSLNPKIESSGSQQHDHLLQHHHHVDQPYGPDSFRGQLSAQTPQLSNHHLLFNAAAAAAAAAHLKSTALQSSISPPSDQSNMLRNYGHNSLNPVIKPKQELDQQPQRIEENRQQQTEQAFTGDFYDSGDGPGNGPDADASVTCTSSVGADQLQSNQQTQQQTSGGLQQPQAHLHRQMPSPGPGTVMLNKPLSQGQQSPQHSITPSGGSSTPEIKYNNDKMANEIQLQLSRSSSAAAISERTLEECWSTLQRVSWHLFRCLFMHKSAMQQIQQQIPRVGLATHGVPGTPNMGGNATPGTDTKPHQCQQCMKSFSSNHQLVQHIRVHTGEKPYKCSYCDRRFKQLSHVQQHTRLHTGERPYKCHLPDCGRAFIQLSNLQQHLRNHDAQVERAKNRPFHCNICGKGFATESSLRTHTSKELQLHLGVLQQHAALIGGPNATSCPVCHKLFLGTEALMDHMKHVHEEKSPPPSGTAASHFSEILNCTGGNGNDNAIGSGPIGSQSTSESSCARIPTHPPIGSGPSLSDTYLGKRRTANHPCPVCGKHYVNEGSLRKHLACHAETSQLPNSLRMWPCSVCQAVFTHENGLLTHMESMRMDPKHQFAAQYVLSRAAAEQRERESILAATIASGSAGSASGIGVGEGRNVLPMGVTNSGGSNSKCPSPSANSECSSNGRLSSSSTSDQDQEHDHGLSENENSSHNNISSTNNNTLCTINNNSCNSSKMNELRLPNSSQYNMDTGLHVANRMSLMAAAAAAVAASRPQEGVDCSNVPSAAVQAAVVNLAAAMRMNNPNNASTALVGHSGHPHSLQHQQHLGEHPLPHHQHPQHLQQQQTPQHHQQQLSHLLGHGHSHPGNNSHSRRSPNINVPSLHIQNESTANASSVAMSMSVNMLRGSLEPDSSLGGMNPIEALHQQHHHQASTYSQHAVAPSTQQAHSQHSHHHPETALRMHQQAEAILRSHEAAFRLVANTGVKSASEQRPNGGSSNGNASANSNEQHRFPTHQQEQQVPPSS